MKIDKPLTSGTLLKRYKRFLADIRLENGEIITTHCPNSGSMLSCNVPGSPVLLSYHDNPKRKYQYTWEMVKVDSIWVGINTMVPNKLVAQSIQAGLIPELTGYDQIHTEIKVSDHSRLDLMLENKMGKCFVEVKNVTLVQDGVALFPDAVTSRGTKHLNELIELKRKEHRAVSFFLIQRSDGNSFSPANIIDPAYGSALRQAYRAGVEILAYRAKVTPKEITIDRRLDVKL